MATVTWKFKGKEEVRRNISVVQIRDGLMFLMDKNGEGEVAHQANFYITGGKLKVEIK